MSVGINSPVWIQGILFLPRFRPKLLTDAGASSVTPLDDWLRGGFFEQHRKRIHNRPFVWRLWDGRKDGFACLVNYRQFNHALLESPTYSYLQDWITAQTAAAKASQTGADLRLAAAQKLQDKLILAGELPDGIFVRCKPLAEQSIGWNPDLNDGVQMNFRRFIQTGILRKTPNVSGRKNGATSRSGTQWSSPGSGMATPSRARGRMTPT